MRLMLWGGITAGYQAAVALVQAAKGLINRQHTHLNEQRFAEDEVDNYAQTPEGEQQLLANDVPYHLVKGLLFGYNAYRLMTQEPDLISFGVGCVTAVQTLQEVYDTATRVAVATPNRHR